MRNREITEVDVTTSRLFSTPLHLCQSIALNFSRYVSEKGSHTSTHLKGKHFFSLLFLGSQLQGRTQRRMKTKKCLFAVSFSECVCSKNPKKSKIIKSNDVCELVYAYFSIIIFMPPSTHVCEYKCQREVEKKTLFRELRKLIASLSRSIILRVLFLRFSLIFACR